MSAFTALNGGFPSSSEAPVIKVDSSAAAESRKSPSPSRPHSQQAVSSADRRDSVERHHPDSSSLKRKRSGSAEPSIKVQHPVHAQERTPDTATEPLPPPPPPPPPSSHSHAHAHSHSHSSSVDARQEARTVLKGEPQPLPRSPIRGRERDHWHHSSREPDDRSPYHSRRGSAASPRQELPTEAGTRPQSRTDHIVVDDGNSSPEPEDTTAPYYGTAYAEQRSNPVLQHDPKKRKRNFSNRTKTGCMTCRKRKKKCDESKPECRSPVQSTSERGE